MYNETVEERRRRENHCLRFDIVECIFEYKEGGKSEEEFFDCLNDTIEELNVSDVTNLLVDYIYKNKLDRRFGHYIMEESFHKTAEETAALTEALSVEYKEFQDSLSECLSAEALDSAEEDQ